MSLFVDPTFGLIPADGDATLRNCRERRTAR